MDDTLISEIAEYISLSFSEELQADIQGSLSLFDAFELQGAYASFPDILHDVEADDTDLTQMKFLSLIHENLNKLFKAHDLEVSENASLYNKNQVLSVLYRLQHLEDPVPVLRILETMLSSEEMFAKIVESYSMLDECVVLETVTSVGETFMNSLKAHLTEQEAEPIEELDQVTRSKLASNLRDFFHNHGSKNLAHEMISNGFAIGLEIKLYYPHVAEYLVTPDDEETAKNMLSLFFMARDTFNDPLKTYRTYSESLIPNTERIMRIESKLAAMLNSLRHYQKATHDAASLSPVLRPA